MPAQDQFSENITQQLFQLGVQQHQYHQLREAIVLGEIKVDTGGVLPEQVQQWQQDYPELYPGMAEILVPSRIEEDTYYACWLRPIQTLAEYADLAAVAADRMTFARDYLEFFWLGGAPQLHPHAENKQYDELLLLPVADQLDELLNLPAGKVSVGLKKNGSFVFPGPAGASSAKAEKTPPPAATS